MTNENPHAKPHISPSQILSYTRCGEAYRRRYIEGEIIPPGIAQVKGTAVHRGAESNFRQKIETHKDIPKNMAREVAVNAFECQIQNEGLFLAPEEEGRGKAIIVGEAKDQTVKSVDVLIEQVSPKYQPESVEETVDIDLPTSSHRLKGIIDLTANGGEIVDLKTSGKAWNQEKADRSVQLTFYSMMVRSWRGKEPKAIKLENICGEKNIKSLTFETKRNMTSYHSLIHRINSVLDGIQKGNFHPANDGAWWCDPRYCGYWGTCKYVNS